jgi:hypothetical protein
MPYWEVVLRLLLTVVLCGAIGFEREVRDQPAGSERTCAFSDVDRRRGSVYDYLDAPGSGNMGPLGH